MKQMIQIFLFGTLFGVILAAAATFTLAIPGTNNLWRAAIFERGGGAWSVDKDGNFHWRWTVQPVSYRGHSAPLIIVPRSRPNPDSSREQL